MTASRIAPSLRAASWLASAAIIGVMGLDGQARAVAVFDATGVSTSGTLVRLGRNWSNEVWMSETHVLRVASRRGPDSLAHELAVAAVLPSDVPYPHPIATGWRDGVLWSLAPRIGGRPLYQAWARSDHEERVMLIDRFAESIRALHAVVLPPGLAQPPPGGGGPPAGITAMPQMIRSFVAEARAEDAMPARIAEVVLRELERAEDALSLEPVATVHTDLSFDNAVWDGERVWLLDLEWCCSGPADYDLVKILGYCYSPQGTVEPEWQEAVAATDHSTVPVLLKNAYPELFSHERLRDRLLVYGMAGFARGWVWRPDLWRSPTDAPNHPSGNLLAFAQGGWWLDLLR
jgi:hypothetical protein